MYAINIVDRFDQINFGIWNAALSTANILRENYNVNSQLWYPSKGALPPDLNYQVEYVPLDSLKRLPKIPDDSIIISHGAWRFPTRLGYNLKKSGYKWMYVPHGNFEPWSISHKAYKKYLYFSLIEHPLSLKADVVRAVSYPEMQRLQRMYPFVELIPNGCNPPIDSFCNKWNNKEPIIFLYIARIHKVKGILPLIQAWKKSSLNQKSNFQLVIAGPDDGLLQQVLSEIQGIENIHYVGAVYGVEKAELLKKAHFFISPSFSEGFSTGIVEAMQYGTIPIISEGCNFPEVFQENLGFKAEPDENSIITALEKIIRIDPVHLNDISERCRAFSSQNYSLKKIASLQYQCFQKLFDRQ
jgi:glycosyltransferase involved in cell wall biosynthesis